MGKRISFSTLADEPVAATASVALDGPPRLRRVPVTTVAANPINPRDDMGNLSDLESMRTVGQLQPCIAVSRSAFSAVYPEHGDALPDGTEYVVVAGSRRRLAAEAFGLDLDIVVRDVLATTRADFYGASISENIDRQDFAPLEEARAIEQLIAECGSGAKAAEILGRTAGWISQRRALLRLSPTMQDLLRSGELLIRDARRLASLPPDEQEPTWRLERQQSDQDADQDQDAAIAAESPSQPAPAAPQVRLLLDATPTEIVETLRQHYSKRKLAAVVRLLADE